MDLNVFNEQYRYLVHKNLVMLASEHLDDLFFASTPLRSKVDKLDFIEFLMAIEEEFEVEIPEEDEEQMETLADIANWLGENMDCADFEAYSKMCAERESEDE